MNLTLASPFMEVSVRSLAKSLVSIPHMSWFLFFMKVHHQKVVLNIILTFIFHCLAVWPAMTVCSPYSMCCLSDTRWRVTYPALIHSSCKLTKIYRIDMDFLKMLPEIKRLALVLKQAGQTYYCWILCFYEEKILEQLSPTQSFLNF